MSRTIDYSWRLAMTGVAFIALWGGGLVLAIVVFPAATFWMGDTPAKGRATRKIIRRSFQLYIAVLCRLGIISLDVEGRSSLAATRGSVVIANHPSLLDVVFLISLLPDARCVVKEQLWRSFFLGPLVRRAGYIANHDDPEILMTRCRTVLREGGNLIVFPEGTRSIPGTDPHFYRGFAHIATLTESDLRPIVIRCDPPTLLKGEAWYKIPARRPHFRVEVHPMIRTVELLQEQPRPRAVRALVAQLEAFYRWKVSHG